MKTKDIEVGGVYAVRQQSRYDSRAAKAEVVAKGAKRATRTGAFSTHYADDGIKVKLLDSWDERKGAPSKRAPDVPFRGGLEFEHRKDTLAGRRWWLGKEVVVRAVEVMQPWDEYETQRQEAKDRLATAQVEADQRAREVNMRANEFVGRLAAVGLEEGSDYKREDYVISHYGALAHADRVNITQIGATKLLEKLEKAR